MTAEAGRNCDCFAKTAAAHSSFNIIVARVDTSAPGYKERAVAARNWFQANTNGKEVEEPGTLHRLIEADWKTEDLNQLVAKIKKQTGGNFGGYRMVIAHRNSCYESGASVNACPITTGFDPNPYFNDGAYASYDTIILAGFSFKNHERFHLHFFL